MTIHRNKINIKYTAEDTAVDWHEDVYNFLKSYNPKQWRKAASALQEAFIQMTESTLEVMYDEIGWND